MQYVAFIRGINVGGHKIVKKETLVAAFEAAGFTGVRTVIQSGNVLFESDETRSHHLEKAIADSLMQLTTYEVTVMVRTVEHIVEIVNSDPFGERKVEPNANTYVAFLAEKPDPVRVKTLMARRSERDFVEVHELETLHLIFKERSDRNLYSVDFVEKDLKVAATVRNWNTVSKIAALG